MRFAVWLLVLFMIVKIVRLFINWSQSGGSDAGQVEPGRPQIPPFENVQEADFEDITPKSPSPEPKEPPA